MEHLGAQLKHAREAQGISLKEIALRTKISVSALEAVERNDFTRLPGGIFGRSFIRAFALEVGVDPDATVASFVEELERSEREAALRGAIRPEITADDQRFLARQRRAVAWLRVAVGVLVLAAIALGTWQVRKRIDTGSTMPEPVSGTSASPPSASPPTAPALASPDVVPPAVAVASEPLAPLPAAGRSPADPAPASADAPAAQAPSAASSAALVVAMTLAADSWVSAVTDGGPPSTRLYKAGEGARFEAAREVRLDIGNAGAVSMTINGRPVRSLGNSGATARLRITPENVADWTR
jgi:cytoskeleton protein RodZ